MLLPPRAALPCRYGFEGEVMAKYDRTVMNLFTEVFNQLPLAAVIDKKVLVVHGGLFDKDGVTLDDIRAIDRCQRAGELEGERKSRTVARRGGAGGFTPAYFCERA